MDDGTYGLSQPIDDPPAPPIPAGPIDDDLACIHCGYNLRGLTDDRACPECGTAVGRSLLGDRLKYADPAWVRCLAKGAGWILASIVLYIALIILSFAIGISAAFNSHQSQATMLFAFLVFASLFPAGAYLIGIWLITKPEPAVIENAEWNLRNVLRWTVVFSTLLTMLEQGLQFTVTFAATVSSLTSSIIGIVAYIVLFIYIRRLALRVPDYALAKQTRTVMWGMIISVVGLLIFSHLETSYGHPGSPLAIPVCMFTVAALVFFIWSIVLAIRYRRLANQAAEDAEQSWARDLTAIPPHDTHI